MCFRDWFVVVIVNIEVDGDIDMIYFCFKLEMDWIGEKCLFCSLIYYLEGNWMFNVGGYVMVIVISIVWFIDS